jgi:hypothetical protein
LPDLRQKKTRQAFTFNGSGAALAETETLVSFFKSYLFSKPEVSRINTDTTTRDLLTFVMIWSPVGKQ